MLKGVRGESNYIHDPESGRPLLQASAKEGPLAEDEDHRTDSYPQHFNFWTSTFETVYLPYYLLKNKNSNSAYNMKSTVH